MAKVSVARTNFNAGEFSILVEGRTDIDKYPASMRRMKNYIAAQQGPALSRSGTVMQTTKYANGFISHLIPFANSDTNKLQLEFCHFRIRFQFRSGIQVYNAQGVSAITAIGVNQFSFKSLDLAIQGAIIGDQVSLAGFPTNAFVNGRTANVIGFDGVDTYTVAVPYLGTVGALVGALVSRIYHIASPYNHNDVRNIRAVQSYNDIYLFCPGYRPRVLTQVSAYNWVMRLWDMGRGPVLQTQKNQGSLTITSTSNPVTLYGGSAISDTGTPANAFDGDTTNPWIGTTDQTGYIGWHFASPVVLDGYVVYRGKSNANAAYSAAGAAPTDFQLQASNDGTNWDILDTQTGFVLYEQGRSPLIRCSNITAYAYYRLKIQALTDNGVVKPQVGELLFARPSGFDSVTMTLSGTYTGLNGGAGFIAGDVGRLIRVKDADGYWRMLTITAVTDATHITALCKDEPFTTLATTKDFQMGFFSDANGWPTMADFFGDRLYVSGVAAFPNYVFGSNVGAYEEFQEKTATDVVLDDGGLVLPLNSRKNASVRGLSGDDKGVVVLTGSGEWIIGPQGQDGAITARSVRARNSTSRGAANIEPVRIDGTLVFVQASRRTLRKIQYDYSTDGYKAPSLSLFASHLGAPNFAQMVYAREPHELMFLRRDDGTIVAVTYNEEQNVIGWSSMDFGGIIESISVSVSDDTAQDELWMVINRNGVGCIERLMPFWDFTDTINTAHFVDSGLRYSGASTNAVYGMYHLINQAVEGLADGVYFKGSIDNNGTLTLDRNFTTLVVGQAYEGFGEISRLEAGAADGTAQGKNKRMNNCGVLVWSSAYGEIGIWNEQNEEYEWRDVAIFGENGEPVDDLDAVPELITDMLGPYDMPQGYGKRGAIAFRRTKPYPFNIISLLPQMNTQDR